MARIIKAPETIELIPGGKSIFLAGSIEMGKAENWQEKLENYLREFENLIIFNPRRDDWDSSWVQSIDNLQFSEQVTWELTAQEHSDIIAIYFSPGTKSPITLLELGLFAHTGKQIVCCPEGYWRKGNVDITCRRYGIKNVDSIGKFLDEIKKRLSK